MSGPRAAKRGQVLARVVAGSSTAAGVEKSERALRAWETRTMLFGEISRAVAENPGRSRLVGSVRKLMRRGLLPAGSCVEQKTARAVFAAEFVELVLQLFVFGGVRRSREQFFQLVGAWRAIRPGDGGAGRALYNRKKQGPRVILKKTGEIQN